MAPTTQLQPPPVTPIEPVEDTLHGISVVDHYRWLEDHNSPRTRAWIKEQYKYTRSYLDAIPRRSRIRRRVEELLTVEAVSEPWKVGNHYFYLKRSPHQEQAVIVMRESEAGEEIVLVNPADRGEGNACAYTIVNISKDARLIAYGVRHGGEDSQSVEFLDVTRRRLLPDRLPHGFGPALVLPLNGRGFYYSHEPIRSSASYRRAVYWHEFGSAPSTDVETFVAGDNSQLHLGVIGSSDAELLGYTVMHVRDPIRFDFYLQDLTDGRPARRILNNIQSVFAPFFVGNKLFALTAWKSPNRRIVSIDPIRPEPEHWVDVVPESSLRIKDYAVAGGSICVAYVEDLSSKIEVFDLEGHRRNAVPCPPRGTVRLLRRPPESDTLFYNFSSFNHPPTIFCYCPRNSTQCEWATSTLVVTSFSFEVEHVRYRSKDGTLVPMSLVTRAGQRLCKKLPTFLTGYGGFGTSLTPQFNVYSTFLVEHGFRFAVANLRGGAEFGEEWHCAGKRRKRQTAIDDFIAAAEWLLENEYAGPGRIAIGGGSNGGLLVGAAMTQRPDLFRAVVCVGPLLDMLRYHLFDSANIWIDEYGTSEVEEDFRSLLGYSPYHSVKRGVPYPAVILISGDADTRCNPLHVRKMAAKLQAVSNSGRPVLLDYSPTWGHAPLQPLSGRIEALTDRLAFICHELDVPV